MRSHDTSLASEAVVGPFTVDRLIGSGGMGEAYLTHRTAAELTQRVARLIDGDVTPDGRPYMAMEYVDGEPLDLWRQRTKA